MHTYGRLYRGQCADDKCVGVQVISTDAVAETHVESILQAFERSAEVASSQATSLPGVNSLCKGFRNGELVILSGPTGTDVYVCCCFGGSTVHLRWVPRIADVECLVVAFGNPPVVPGLRV
jgi:hypothetical protein